MLGRYRWESDLSVEQLVEAVSTRVPHIYEADTDRDRRGERQIAYGSNVVYQYDESGKMIFYSFSDSAYGVTITLLTCRVTAGEGGYGSVLTGKVPRVLNFLLPVFLLILRIGPNMMQKDSLQEAIQAVLPFFVVVGVFMIYGLGVGIYMIETGRKAVLDLLDDITGSSWMAARKKKKA